jgi:hypothetical protein
MSNSNAPRKRLCEGAHHEANELRHQRLSEHREDLRAHNGRLLILLGQITKNLSKEHDRADEAVLETTNLKLQIKRQKKKSDLQEKLVGILEASAAETLAEKDRILLDITKLNETNSTLAYNCRTLGDRSDELIRFRNKQAETISDLTTKVMQQQELVADHTRWCHIKDSKITHLEHCLKARDDIIDVDAPATSIGATSTDPDVESEDPNPANQENNPAADGTEQSAAVTPVVRPTRTAKKGRSKKKCKPKTHADANELLALIV